MAKELEAGEIGEQWIAPVQAGRQLGVTSARIGQLVSGGQLRALSTPLGKLIDSKSVDALQERRARKGGRGR